MDGHTSGSHTHADGGGHPAHGAGHHDHAAMFRNRFWVTLVLTVPVLVYSEHVRGWVGLADHAPPGGDAVSVVLGAVIFFYGGWPFLTGAVDEVRARRPGMMLLIAMAITVAFVASLAGALNLIAVEVWWELSLLIVIMLLGHWLEMRAIGQAGGALAALAELLPEEAERLGDDGTVEAVPVAHLAVGDLVLVRPGGRVPADGTVESGEAEVDESMVTGESGSRRPATTRRSPASTAWWPRPRSRGRTRRPSRTGRPRRSSTWPSPRERPRSPRG